MHTGLVSRPSAASARARAEREPGPSARIAKRDPPVLPLGPGSRSARPGHERTKFGAHISRWPSSQTHDVKQRSVVRSRDALRRPGWSLSIRVHPERGVGGAPTGALSLLSRLRDATAARVRRSASHDAGRSPLGAPPWRFSAGGRASISGIASGSVQRCSSQPGPNAWRAVSRAARAAFGEARRQPLMTAKMML